jgi:transposase
VARSIAAHLDRLDHQIEALMTPARQVITTDAVLTHNLARVRGITGLGEITAIILPAGLPNIAAFMPKALGRVRRALATRTQLRLLGAQAGQAQPHRQRPPAQRLAHGRAERQAGQKALAGFVQRLTAAGKPNKVILVAVARKLLVHAHAVIRTQQPLAWPADCGTYWQWLRDQATLVWLPVVAPGLGWSGAEKRLGRLAR